MNIHYKKLTENELDKFIEMRILQLREEGAKEDIDLVPALKDYYNRHMANGTFVSWLALENDKSSVQVGCLLLRNHPTLAVQMDELASCQVCIRSRAIVARGLQKSCLQEWSTKQGSTVAEQCRLRHRIWEGSCTRILGL